MDEPDIAEELFIEIQQVWKESKGKTSLIPIPEKPTRGGKKRRGKPPSIDFCFRDKWNKESYFGVEYKLLKEDNTHYKKYVKEGVNRYLGKKYSKNCFIGSMIGFVVTGNFVKIIEGVKKKVDEVSDLKRSYQIDGFDEHYESKHTRYVDSSLFLIHHLFFSFN